jgi:hypothetical protein
MLGHPAFTVKIEQDGINSARYRWRVFVGDRERDVSVYSFATKREALKDAERFIAKLNSTRHQIGDSRTFPAQDRPIISHSYIQPGHPTLPSGASLEACFRAERRPNAVLAP